MKAFSIKLCDRFTYVILCTPYSLLKSDSHALPAICFLFTESCWSTLNNFLLLNCLQVTSGDQAKALGKCVTDMLRILLVQLVLLCPCACCTDVADSFSRPAEVRLNGSAYVAQQLCSWT